MRVQKRREREEEKILKEVMVRTSQIFWKTIFYSRIYTPRPVNGYIIVNMLKVKENEKNLKNTQKSAITCNRTSIKLAVHSSWRPGIVG